ncbi:extracellular solute-binding protein [Rhizobium giardinii]|uniref:Multiple sugar transport system substrate-binding protein n=1 Tax=Rhizobium giardinii TaxID=56731 RepID=A0A7W8XCD8_9HYPH|nr:extracellular solute-binding protein [Rhizobium giardinii]MBB5538788.1 multiple sugar transport system substrate-binding protein [Rhizobium giardinii]
MKIDRRTFCASLIIGAGIAAASVASAQEPIKLRVTAAPSNVSEMYKALATAFEASHPNIRVTLDTTYRDYNALVDATLRDALTGEVADVSIQGNNKIRLYVDRKMAVPLDAYFSEASQSAQSTLSSSVASVGRFGDKVYGLGLSVSAPVVFFNLDLVEKAGVDAANLPTTWEGILKLAQKIDNPSSNTLGAYFTYDQADWFWIALIESQGAQMMSADEKHVGFAGPEGLRAMQLLKSFGQAGQSKFDMPRDQVRQLFASGKLGILVDSSGSLGGFEKQAAGHFKVATAAFPLLSPDARLPAGGALGIVFTKDPERQKAAWEFLNFAAGPEGQTIIAKNSSYMVANSRVATDPSMLGGFYATQPNMKPVVDALPILDGWYAFPGQNSGKITNTLIDHMRSVTTLKVEPEAALAAMTRDVESLLPR